MLDLWESGMKGSRILRCRAVDEVTRVSATRAIQSLLENRGTVGNCWIMSVFWERSRRYFSYILQPHEERRTELASWILVPVLYIGFSELDLHEDQLSSPILLFRTKQVVSMLIDVQVAALYSRITSASSQSQSAHCHLLLFLIGRRTLRVSLSLRLYSLLWHKLFANLSSPFAHSWGQ